MIKKKSVVFKTFEEYQKYYAADIKKQSTKGGKYYRIGADIAKMACETGLKQANSL